MALTLASRSMNSSQITLFEGSYSLTASFIVTATNFKLHGLPALGSSSKSAVIIRGSGRMDDSVVTSFANLFVENIEFRDFSSTKPIFSVSSGPGDIRSLQMANVTFRNNRAAAFVFTAGANVALSNCQFVNNSAQFESTSVNNGGVIQIYVGKDTTVPLTHNVSFLNCTFLGTIPDTFLFLIDYG